MIRGFMRAGDPSLRRPLRVSVLVALLGAGCSTENPEPLALSDPPESTTPVLASVTYTGIPFGPSGLWTVNKLNWGPQPFTASQNYINADTLILQINAARNTGQRLVLAMTGGPSTTFTTNGQFDLAKWKRTMDTYKKTTLKTAVAAGVSDGTIIGNQLIDEPETKRWGTVLTKGMIDQMATYAKAIFPTLPMGVNHGPPGYKWRTTETYKVLDYALYQYNYYITSGNITSWRTAVLARANIDGVRPALSLNVLNGGIQDKFGSWFCVDSGQAGTGTYYPNCRMTADQVKTWGKALAPYGCFMMLWRFDATYMNNLANQAAFKEIATLAASKPKPSCKRP
jgi:hypothetical protein